MKTELEIVETMLFDAISELDRALECAYEESINSLCVRVITTADIYNKMRQNLKDEDIEAPF